jgi:hypothetical protein
MWYLHFNLPHTLNFFLSDYDHFNLISGLFFSNNYGTWLLQIDIFVAPGNAHYDKLQTHNIIWDTTILFRKMCVTTLSNYSQYEPILMSRGIYYKIRNKITNNITELHLKWSRDSELSFEKLFFIVTLLWMELFENRNVVNWSNVFFPLQLVKQCMMSVKTRTVETPRNNLLHILRFQKNSSITK